MTRNKGVVASKGVVKTSKASYYVKLLCTHFSRKVQASFEEPISKVDFGFAQCSLLIKENEFLIDCRSETEEGFKRVVFVLKDHIERFGIKDGLTIQWLH